MQVRSRQGIHNVGNSPLLCFFERQSTLRIECKDCLRVHLYVFSLVLLSHALSAKTKEKVSTVQRHTEILELRSTIKRKISEFRQSQRVLMPGLGPILDEMRDDGAAGDSFKLLLPSELSVEDRGAWCHPDIPALEFRFRFAQADDRLAELRRLLRLFQNLRDENLKQLSNVTKANTHTQGIFNSFQARIQRCANRYSHA